MSELERRRKESERKGNPYLYFSLGVGFVIAAVLLIITANTAAAGLPFVIAAAALLGKGLSDVRGSKAPWNRPSAKGGSSCRR